MRNRASCRRCSLGGLSPRMRRGTCEARPVSGHRPPAYRRRPAAPGAQARPVCRSDWESVVVRFLQADLMRRRSGCELVSLSRASVSYLGKKPGRRGHRPDSVLPSVRALDFRRSATQAAVPEQTKNRHDQSSLCRSASSFGAVEQTYISGERFIPWEEAWSKGTST